MRFAVYHATQHLTDTDLETAANRCPFCQGADLMQVGQLQKDPDVHLMHCHRCQATSASRIPTKAALDRYYSHYYEDVAADGERLTMDSSDKFARHLTRYVECHMTRREIRILDFGGGDGTMAVRMAERLAISHGTKSQVTVVDYHPDVASPRHEAVCVEHHADLDTLPKDGFDVVIASAVVEHLPEPRLYLKELFSRLDRGGLFYARTPYMAPFVKIFEKLGMQWDFTFPAHIHDLGGGFWEHAPEAVEAEGHFRVLVSRPSLVETSFASHPLRTVLAYSLKSPWWLLGKRYQLVGGWEVLIQRTTLI